MKRPPLTLDQHRQLAALIRDPRIIRAACDIPNHCGLSSRVGKRARRIHSQLLALKSDLENHCASDHGKAHIGIYYGTESP